VGQLVDLEQRLTVGEAAIALDGKLRARSLTGLIVEHIMQPHAPFPPLLLVVVSQGSTSFGIRIIGSAEHRRFRWTFLSERGF
jgi:hypothetical protein